MEISGRDVWVYIQLIGRIGRSENIEQMNQEDREEEKRKEEEENYEFLGNKNEILILSVSFFYAEIQLTKRPSRVTHSPKLTLHSHATSSWLGSTRRAMLTQWMEKEHSPLQ